ncbi:MAG: terpene cyclase/mutase family protein [Pirellulaceae bacterium]|nr:terpene cyclase/mutase family protein [Pirellulaceae bacterium]MDG2103614.1 terpene cyclase/mutase family protein [Pirellulaceae bacterium]
MLASSALLGGSLLGLRPVPAASSAVSSGYNETWQRSVDKGLSWLANQQTRLGHWTHTTYPTAMTALAGTAMICSGSTATQGPWSENIRRAVDYLITKSRPNGLIGDPLRDNRYTYGHGFSMLFLSQVLGEEEDEDRREELTEILQKSVDFSVNAQTRSGGWGYVSAVENSTFDEGSTTITQVQGLRACRNAGILVPKDAILRARQYIYDCKNVDGGISYSSRTKGTSRHAITAAALSALYNAGDYESEHIQPMWDFCKKHLHDLGKGSRYGHWHYTYLYYAQVVYRQKSEVWKPFRDRLYEKIVREQLGEGNWTGGNISDSYVSSCNLIILQLDKGYLPIFQR